MITGDSETRWITCCCLLWWGRTDGAWILEWLGKGGSGERYGTGARGWRGCGGFASPGMAVVASDGGSRLSVCPEPWSVS